MCCCRQPRGRLPQGNLRCPLSVHGAWTPPRHHPSWGLGVTCTVAGGSGLAAPRPRAIGARSCLALASLPSRCLPALSTRAYLVPLFNCLVWVSVDYKLPADSGVSLCSASSAPSPVPGTCLDRRNGLGAARPGPPSSQVSCAPRSGRSTAEVPAAGFAVRCGLALRGRKTPPLGSAGAGLGRGGVSAPRPGPRVLLPLPLPLPPGLTCAPMAMAIYLTRRRAGAGPGHCRNMACRGKDPIRLSPGF